jgi:beta-galactosidase
MLKSGASFSIYMVHGGTSFGLWSGADRPYKPDTSSYDYDAPISEAGWPTEKFAHTRELMAKYLLPGETIPEPPQRNPVISFRATELSECAPLFENLPTALRDQTPRTMEQYDQGYGCILYRTTLPAGDAGTLEASVVHDFGFVFLDGQRVGVMDRRSRHFKVNVPERAKAAQLDILVEAMGRVNFGPELHDRKGIVAPVRFAGSELSGWEIYRIPLDGKMLAGARYGAKSSGPALWRGKVTVDQPADTFLDMRPWGKGVVWVNGYCLGRFWNIGPTQTMYAPGCWLKTGTNEVVILDLLGPEKPIIAGLENPILNELRPELDFARARRPQVKLAMDGVEPVKTGQFEPGAQVQDVHFDRSAGGRYFCIESLNAHDGKPFAAVAELDLLDESGKPLSHEGWTIAYVDSEERDREDGSAENAIDGQTANFWHTQWGEAQPNHPHRLVLDLGHTRALSGVRYVPRQGGANVAGRIKDYRIYVGDALVRP